jgi:hypothetical protein
MSLSYDCVQESWLLHTIVFFLLNCIDRELPCLCVLRTKTPKEEKNGKKKETRKEEVKKNYFVTYKENVNVTVVRMCAKELQEYIDEEAVEGS